jgi:hypothetical protein
MRGRTIALDRCYGAVSVNLRGHLLIAVLALGCAHDAARKKADALSDTVKQLHLSLRWKDFTGALAMIVPEKREAFATARMKLHDDQDLSIGDYEVLQIVMEDSALRAVAVASMSWSRLPSTSVQTDRVRSELVYRDGSWLLERQSGGPFDAELR